MQEWGFVFELSAKPWDAETVEVREDGVAWSPSSLESLGQSDGIKSASCLH